MKFYEKDNLKNSRIFYDKSPPRYMMIFIISMVILTISCIVSLNYVTRIYIVECNGIVKNKDSHFIRSEVSGEINNIEKEEGAFVNIGDTILTISRNKTDNINTALADEESYDYLLKANSKGIVHYYLDAIPSYPIQENDVIAEVNNDSIKDPLIIIADIPVKDISKVKINQKVKIRVVGVNSQKYGLLSGTIESIENISENINENTYDRYFKCVIKPNSIVLKAKQEEIKIISSMPVTAQIIYDEETYLDWLKEMIFNIAH